MKTILLKIVGYCGWQLNHLIHHKNILFSIYLYKFSRKRGEYFCIKYNFIWKTHLWYVEGKSYDPISLCWCQERCLLERFERIFLALFLALSTALPWPAGLSRRRTRSWTFDPSTLSKSRTAFPLSCTSSRIMESTRVLLLSPQESYIQYAWPSIHEIHCIKQWLGWTSYDYKL